MSVMSPPLRCGISPSARIDRNWKVARRIGQDDESANVASSPRDPLLHTDGWMDGGRSRGCAGPYCASSDWAG